MATAVGLLTQDGKSYDDAVATLQARLDAFGANAHTPLLRAIGEEIKNVRRQGNPWSLNVEVKWWRC